MTVPYALLGLLEGTTRHGYDVKQAYDRRFGGTRPLRVGHVYRILAQLVRDGHVAEAGTEPGAGPERKRYAITEAGVTDLGRWLAEPEEPQPQLQAVLFVKVVLALMSGRPAEEYLDAQRDLHLARMRELTAARRAAGPQAALLADYQLFHIEADLRWIEHAAGRLDALRAEEGQ
ncbi:PadR family transcriptional regulator [Dactylosporangium sp. NPDC048998]|uniref:PadR family transcriptional regulator n=1 Tax=Dactylosporangium sp. NPDC048998 TaxID=3363976 RepID=UPI003712AEA7